MGNCSSRTSLTPTSLMHCINASGEVDVDLYQLFRRMKHHKALHDNEEIVKACVALANEEMV
jgi:hypothetical protein